MVRDVITEAVEGLFNAYLERKPPRREVCRCGHRAGYHREAAGELLWCSWYRCDCVRFEVRR